MAVLAAVASVCVLAVVFIDGDFYENGKKWMKWLLIVTFASGIFAVLIPSRKDLMAIYGVGGVIDYVESNEKAKELPDKVVEVLYDYLDKVKEEEK